MYDYVDQFYSFKLKIDGQVGTKKLVLSSNIKFQVQEGITKCVWTKLW